jgi:phosphopantothenoylcysteine decarboxylase/phosphopantothenate--cysteine ligase
MSNNIMPYDDSKHTSKDIIGSYGDELRGKKIILCVTASVAAYKAIDLARLLMRHGAQVYPVMSKRAQRFVTKDMLSWATGNECVVDLTWRLEHIHLVKESDMVVVYPCTANTLARIANGMEDSSVSTIASVALGLGKPMIIALAMHEPMYDNPVVKRNIGILEPYVEFVKPRLEEGKAKVAEPEYMLRRVIDLVNRSSILKGKSVLVTAGATVEYIDPIRVVTNLASGRFGIAIAREAMLMGADVTLIYANIKVEPPKGVRLIKVNTSKEMFDAVMSELKSKSYHAVIMNAAVSDFRPSIASDTKIDSKGNDKITLVLEPTEKIVDHVKKISPNSMLVAFKADSVNQGLVEKAIKRMRECDADLMIANDALNSIDLDSCELFIIKKSGDVKHLGLVDKTLAARIILGEVAEGLNKNRSDY